ncbi:MAG: fumarylacetoacetate hydrolase family protein [Bacteroidales bacterium]|mgnify:CR=1 FL=1|jgi:acylpyruvate hydrolase|nr:fumarylacetoacetate hydrolase family protein [Bacteroidales bacterium]MDI9576116.1 fumarylacetoacetate hydrolase family protein [Bacteroidota bacterium]MDD2593124.1 fumarylacetoacetate hydrolase family protein [Bacteroidales bacterium]MDD3755781.1 fumarylacetoacetate hydrolase family protein [Bacteroidales bacterium]MDY0400494.1 fumarylacetoacetate hydrolase family protein [Bacteroidales bacterium]
MKIICIGRNYLDHITELNDAVPQEPIFFMKHENALIKNKNMPFFLPDFSDEIHYEVELVIKIGKVGKTIPKKHALDFINGITVGIDFTARDLQRKCIEEGLPWEICKSFDYSAPIGSFVAIERFSDIKQIHFSLKKNDKMVQYGCSGDMIFFFDDIISYISKFITLKTGDIIFTGTPKGVGQVKKGDKLEAYLENEKMLNKIVL